MLQGEIIHRSEIKRVASLIKQEKLILLIQSKSGREVSPGLHPRGGTGTSGVISGLCG